MNQMLLGFVWGSFTYTTREKVLDIGAVAGALAGC
jgi:hypothetical protein